MYASEILDQMEKYFNTYYDKPNASRKLPGIINFQKVMRNVLIMTKSITFLKEIWISK